jgi:predicted nucleic acid-binding protein
MTPLALVVDASVAVKLSLKEPLTAEALALFALNNDPANLFHVPDFFYAECANIFWKQVKRGLITVAQATQYISDMVNLSLIRTATSAVCEQALDLALKYDISAYDACYAALAQQEQVELITADQKLVAKLAGVKPAVVWLGHWQPPSGAGATGT